MSLFEKNTFVMILLTFSVNAFSAENEPRYISDAPDGKQVFINAQDLDIFGVVYDETPASEEKKPAVIFIHGYDEDGIRAGASMSYFAKYYSAQLNSINIAVTLRGWPDTGGVHDCGLVQPQDISYVVDWLASQPDVDPDRIAIVGLSHGAQVAFLTAAINPKVKVIVAESPLIDVTRWAENIDLTQEEIEWYVEGVCTNPGSKRDRSPLYVADKINSEVLIIHGEKDTRVIIEQSEWMVDALIDNGNTPTFIRLPEAAHDSGSPAWEGWMETEIEFLKEHL